MRPILLIAAAGALVAGAFVADRTFQGTGGGPTASTTPSPDEARSSNQRPLPSAVLSSLDGERVDVAGFRGRPLLVNFWATWCKPCRREIPLLIALRDEHADRDLEIVGIAIDEMAPTRAMAEAEGIDYPVLVGEQEGIEAMVAFGAPTTALPFTAAVNRDGQIVAGHVGELTREEAQDMLAAILDGATASGKRR